MTFYKYCCWLPIFFGLLLLGPAGCGRFGPTKARPRERPDDIVLFVNGSPVERQELEAMVTAIIGHAPADFPRERIEQMMPRIEKEARENLIRERLIDQALELEKIHPSSSEVEAEMEVLREYLAAQNRSLVQYLAQQKKSEDQLRGEIARQVAINQLLDRRLNLGEPSEAELREFFEKKKDHYRWQDAARVSLILVALPVGRTPSETESRELYNRAVTIREKLLGGYDFVSLARTESADATAATGGDAGWISRGSPLPGEVIDAALRLPLGMISPVLRTASGFYVLKVWERRAGHEGRFDEVRDIVARDLRQSQRAQRLPELLQQLREQARVVEPSLIVD